MVSSSILSLLVFILCLTVGYWAGRRRLLARAVAAIGGNRTMRPRRVSLRRKPLLSRKK